MNFRVRYTLYLSLMIFFSRAFCQENELREPNEVPTSLAVSAGVNNFHQRDKYISPYIFNGVSFASKISFQVKTENNQHRVDGFFTIGALSPDIPQREVTLKGGYLSYSFVHSLSAWKLGGNPVQLLVGGGISSLAMNTDFNTTDETGYITLDQSWYWSHSLNVALLGKYQLDGEKNLSLQLTAPIVGLVSRPENGHRLSQKNLEVVDKNFFNAFTQGKIDYLWNNFVLFTDFEYRQSLSSKFDLIAAYRFGYVSSNRPASTLSTHTYFNNFLAGIEWLL